MYLLFVYFYPRSPCGERHLRVLDGSKSSIISIHALLAESDHTCQYFFLAIFEFLSTLSLRRATYTRTQSASLSLFLSTLSLRRATRQPGYLCLIHYFYPRSPCGERLFALWMARRHLLFLSTLSLRRATLAGPSGPAFLYNFYPRSPCGERHDWPPVRDIIQWISIHALLAESDERANRLANAPPEISIHALLAESDGKSNKLAGLKLVFLSTLSLRRATMTHTQKFCVSIFLSTLSLRRATILLVIRFLIRQFLSTLSLRRATLWACPAGCVY